MKWILLLLLTLTSPLATAQTPSTNFWKTIKMGPDVYAYYEGRSPCQEIVRQLNAPNREECIKIKWQLILYQDPKTKAPTHYALGGFIWRNPPKTGKWSIAKGTKEDPNAVVIQLDSEEPNPFLSFQKMDENILFFLDKDRNLLIGNPQFSYTLNRIIDNGQQ